MDNWDLNGYITTTIVGPFRNDLKIPPKQKRSLKGHRCTENGKGFKKEKYDLTGIRFTKIEAHL